MRQWLAIVGLVALTGAVVAGWAAVQTDEATLDHVIVISIDTLRADHLGVYGSDVQTPAIDAFAEQAVVFEHHISSAPTTLASHTALMTGTFPHTHGAPRNGFVVHDDNTTLAEVLQDNGFVTAGFIGAMPLHSSSNFPQGFQHYDEEMPIGRRGGRKNQRDGSLVNSAFFDWLDTQTPRKDRLFVFLHYFDVHDPYQPPEPYASMYGTTAIPDAGGHRHIKQVRKYERKGNWDAPAHSNALKALYKGGVTYMDTHFGALISGLEARGLVDDTLIVLTSDHGESFNDHPEEYWNHGYTVFDGTVRTPLIVRVPGGQPAGKTGHLASNIDVVPSILELLEIEAPAAVEGVSFAPVLRGETMEQREPVFSEGTKPWQNHEPWHNVNMDKAIRTPTEKVIWNPRKKRRFYFDLAADPDEQANLFKQNRKNPQVTKLNRALNAFAKDADPHATHRIEDEAVQAALEALGYVEEEATED